METLAGTIFRLVCALLAGAQLFFIAVAAQVVFPKEVAALAPGDFRRTLAADLVGKMLARLDAATLIGCALAVGCAIFLHTRGAPLRLALFPLLAALCALASAFGTTPAIHALREAGQTALPQFGRLHALSGVLLVAQLLLLLATALRGVPTRT